MKKTNCLLIILLILLDSPAGLAGLVAHYKFDESPGATTAANQVSGSTPGVVGSAVTTGSVGIAGSAYNFGGATATQADIVDMENASFFTAINASGKLSFSAWVKTTDTTGNRNTVAFAGSSTTANTYADMGVAATQADHLGSASARNRPVAATSTEIFSTPTIVNDGNWHHLVMTIDLSVTNISLYVDGVMVKSQTLANSNFPAFNNFEIGRLGRQGTQVDPYQGLIDDVQVYDHALTPTQITYIKEHPGLAYTSQDLDTDGLEDSWEIRYFGNITAQNGPGDSDSDGANNLEEQAAKTDPNVADTDGDGRTDGAELKTAPLTNPLDSDSDDDGLTDGAEVNTYATDPNSSDTDSDDLPDGWEIANELNPKSSTGNDGNLGDPDGDGLNNAEEYRFGVKSTHPRKADTDGDGYSDLQENSFGFWTSISETGSDPLTPDTDGDGIPDGRENPQATYVPGVTSGTDPNLTDTDADGFPDNYEFFHGTDPTNVNSFPSVARGLVAHYKFNEVASATTAVNALGGSSGMVGSAVVTGVPGIAGNAYRFGNLAGQNDIVDMNNAIFLTDLKVSKALTYTAWIKSTDVSGNRNTIISAADTTLANSYVDVGIAGVEPYIGALSGRARYNTNDNIAEAFSNTAPNSILVNNNGWHHVAMTIDLATHELKLFVDGIPTGAYTAMTAAEFPVFNNFEIGRLGRQSPSDAYEGLIDDVQIYNEALAPARIAALYAIPGVSADEDHDGLDDQWEIDHFASITAQNGSGDPDGDGILNEAEETAGTNPGGSVTPTGQLKITSVNFVAGGNYVINFSGSPNTTYRVAKSATVGGFAAMTPPVTATTNTSGIGVATVPASQAGGSRGFFRLETP